jgi:hypothetical protein
MKKRKMKKEKCQPYEIDRTLVLSTAHITLADSKLLDDGTIPCTRYEHGYLIYVCDHKYLSDERVNHVQTGMSAALYQLLLLTAGTRCAWLKLDRDGPVRVDRLPKFEW